MPAVFHQRMRHTQHHRDVCAHMRRDPLGALPEKIHSFGTHRIDADQPLTTFTQRVKIANALLIASVPRNLQRIKRVGAPQHHDVRMLQYQRPARLLLIHLIAPHDIRHDRLSRPSRIIAQMPSVAARQAHIALQQRRRFMQHAVGAPTVRSSKDRRRTIAVADAFVLSVDERQRIVPAHAHKFILATHALRIIRRG
ncbi:hypothetical protein D3C78_1238300 [compost metagenome]